MATMNINIYIFRSNVIDFACLFETNGGPGISVGIATDYRLDGPGIESRWGKIFRTCPYRPWDPPSLLSMGTGFFPGLKSGRGVTLTPQPLLVPRL
jgi:hypothetical protein